MKKVMVWGARQDTGFELCSQLLDNGFQVLGVDHSGWQSLDHEDRWMLIGRNANLQYIDREGWDPSSIQNGQCMIFPLDDYHRHGDDETVSELLTDLEKIQERSTTKCFIFIEPSSNEKMRTDLSGKLKEFFETQSNNDCIRRYRSDHNGVATIVTGKGDEWKRILDHPCTPIEQVITDLLEMDTD